MTPECQIALNFLMNHYRGLGCQYKAAMYAFHASGDEGVAAFLRNEKMERYIKAHEIAEYIINHGGTVTLDGTAAPATGSATPQTVQALVNAEEITVTKIGELIREAEDRQAYRTGRYLQCLQHDAQYEHNEVTGVSREISKLAPDAGAMSQYNIFLAEKYADRYNDHDD